MRILAIINWKIRHLDYIPDNIQPSDFDCPEVPFWFFKYFNNRPDVDVIDINCPKIFEIIENKLRFHIYQTFKALASINKYDLVLVHGSNSAMLLCALKRIFKFKTPPILDVDISSFHQAKTSGLMFHLSRFASREFDYMVYHASSQDGYYRKYYPWLANRSRFIPVGVDFNYWESKNYTRSNSSEPYYISVGYRKRDWDTLINAFNNADVSEKLYLVGNPNIKVTNPNIKVLPFLPIDKLMNYIVNSKASIIPLDNFNYSFGQLTLLQQMAVATPIIAANVPAIFDYIDNSSGVVKYRPYDSDDLCKKIRFMSSCDEDELISFGRSNQLMIKNVFSEKNMALAFEEICNMLIS